MARTPHLIRSIIAAAALAFALGVHAHAQPAKEYGFGFKNFSDAVLTWDHFRNAYYGVPDNGSASAFDALFHELVFKTISKNGNCFGMSLLSILMNRDGGHMGYCAPPYQYSGDMNGGGGPTDANLRRVINILQGHQLSLPSLMEILDQINGMHSQDGSIVIKRCETVINKEGPCIISVTKSLNPIDGGHSMIAYSITGNKIMIVDPNRVWQNTNLEHRHWYESDSNYITCTSGSWKFEMKGHAMWPSPAGHLTVIPVSVAGPTGRVPSSLGLSVSELVSKIFIVGKGADATILQVTDERGRRLFVPDSKEIDTDTATGMRCIVPWFPEVAPGQTTPFPFEQYFNLHPSRACTVEFTTGTAGAVFAIGNNDSYVTLDCATPDADVTVALTGIGTASPSYEIRRTSRLLLARGETVQTIDATRARGTVRMHDTGACSFAHPR